MQREKKVIRGAYEISVIGCGHVGSVVAACLANLVNKVIVVDTDEEKVQMVNFPVTEECSNSVLAVPMFPETKNEEIGGIHGG